MEKEIKIPTDRKKFFRQYVEILKPVCKLRDREADVLAALLYQSYIRRDINNLIERFKLVFDYDTKITILDDIKMDMAQFRNCLTELRKKQIIGKANVIGPGFLVNPPDDNIFSVKYSFVFKKE